MHPPAVCCTHPCAFPPRGPRLPTGCSLQRRPKVMASINEVLEQKPRFLGGSLPPGALCFSTTKGHARGHELDYLMRCLPPALLAARELDVLQPVLAGGCRAHVGGSLCRRSTRSRAGQRPGQFCAPKLRPPACLQPTSSSWATSTASSTRRPAGPSSRRRGSGAARAAAGNGVLAVAPPVPHHPRRLTPPPAATSGSTCRSQELMLECAAGLPDALSVSFKTLKFYSMHKFEEGPREVQVGRRLGNGAACRAGGVQRTAGSAAAAPRMPLSPATSHPADIHRARPSPARPPCSPTRGPWSARTPT